jgi:hypothetical protein
MLDINKAVRDLKSDKTRLDRVIAVLESVQKEHLADEARPALPDQCSELSQRMKQFWADRREKKPRQRS